MLILYLVLRRGFFPCHNKDVDHSRKIMALDVCSCFIAEFNKTD